MRGLPTLYHRYLQRYHCHLLMLSAVPYPDDLGLHTIESAERQVLGSW